MSDAGDRHDGAPSPHLVITQVPTGALAVLAGGLLITLVALALHTRKLAAEAGAPRCRLAEVIRASAPLRPWRYIVIHHSATDGGSAAALERHHMLYNRWPRIGYHFVIGNGTETGDGQIEPTLTWQRQLEGIHARSREYNQWGIAICLVGNFEKQPPTETQLRALTALAATLANRFDIAAPRVTYHNRIVETDCPGRRFPYAPFEERLAAALASPPEVIRYHPKTRVTPRAEGSHVRLVAP